MASKNKVKTHKKWGKSNKKVISHRPFSMFITVDISTGIDRYEHEHRPLRDDIRAILAPFFNVFALLMP